MKNADRELAQAVATAILRAHMPDMDKGGELDNDGFVRLAQRVADATSSFLAERGLKKSDATRFRAELICQARDLFIRLWIKQAKEDSEDADQTVEERSAREEFDNCLGKK